MNQNIANIFSVSELSNRLKHMVETQFDGISVRGEFSEVKRAASGHIYASLKDENALINVIIWRSTADKLAILPEDGLEVIARGRLSTYPARSNYQMLINSVEVAGQGALLKLIEERKQKLAQEGLFDPSRKKLLPKFPQHIAVVTSPTGAVIRDILHRLNERFPVHVQLWPVLVQGEGAAAQITKALLDINDLNHKPDLVIVARGGGALEDLMPFNEESVVRAAARLTIPLISAVGHETDTTLIDWVSDLRAPTPTAAAELATPHAPTLLVNLDKMHTVIVRGLTRHLEQSAQKLDHLSFHLERLIHRIIERGFEHIHRLVPKGPSHVIALYQQKMDNMAARAHRAMAYFTKAHFDRLTSLARILESISFETVLERGFVMIRDPSGKPVTSSDALAKGDHLRLQFSKGRTRTATLTD